MGEFETVTQTPDELEDCITVKNSPNPFRVYIRLCKHAKKVLYFFYKKTSFKNFKTGKDEKFILLIKMYVSSYNINNLTNFHSISQLNNQNLHLKIWWSALWCVYNLFCVQIFIKAQVEIWEIFVHFLISVSKIWQTRMFPWKYSNLARNT